MSHHEKKENERKILLMAQPMDTKLIKENLSLLNIIDFTTYGFYRSLLSEEEDEYREATKEDQQRLRLAFVDFVSRLNIPVNTQLLLLKHAYSWQAATAEQAYRAGQRDTAQTLEFYSKNPLSVFQKVLADLEKAEWAALHKKNAPSPDIDEEMEQRRQLIIELVDSGCYDAFPEIFTRIDEYLDVVRRNNKRSGFKEGLIEAFKLLRIYVRNHIHIK